MYSLTEDQHICSYLILWIVVLPTSKMTGRDVV